MALIEPIAFVTKSGRSGVVRCAEWTDAQRLIDHRVQDWETASESGVGPPDPATLVIADQVRKIEDRRSDPDELFLIAELEGELGSVLAGVILFHTNRRPRIRHHGHFGISVAEPYRGDGLGRALLGALVDWARAHPIIEKVCLGVLANNHRAIALYHAMGFVEECRRDREFKFNHGVYVDDIQMSLWVKDIPR